MRVCKGCERCRYRHIRCIIPPGASACAPCTRLGRDCRLDPRFQFKAVHHVYQKDKGTAARFDLNWDEEQVWVDVSSKPVTFVLETDGSSESGEFELSREAYLTPPHLPHIDQSVECGGSFENRPTMHSPLQISRPQRISAIDSPFSSQSDQGSTLSHREASLMRCFIQKIAPWVRIPSVADICDPQCHFSTIVPQRALQVPMVLKALMALAARHDAILTGNSDWEASSYHGQCLELLIPVLDQPENTYNENVLITVVILRICEELENITDEKFHLLGSNRLINLMSRSTSSGGLAEAVSWQFLRQAIYSSVAQYQPLQLNLENYQCSTMFQRTDDAAVANMIIFHCAQIIQHCRDGPGALVDISAWCHSAKSIEDWHQSMPTTWQPLRYQAPNIDADRPFPEIWIMSAPAVVGMQYYHTACIFLSLSDPHSQPANDYELARNRRMTERTIATHLVTVIGLSWSNESVQNAYFMACHLLHRFGYCLRHVSEQQGALRFLGRVEKVLGWRTSWIKQELEQQWTELAQLDLHH
ncbi:hypothetical protein N7493_003724 [Penicillium malachiteum]|uniref:Zn(2)-C6 fungal-type domain-containing protein n=1 Tax=Penicillium malachiteum TaxID=1324776 RepID=A0AAD6MXW3_9EURO|nr:hypothetical protein N7493_003724 [Penicillium malachiteum]